MRIQLARSEAERLIERFGATVPVNVEAIAESLGLRVILEDLGTDVSGLLVYSNRTASIGVRKSDPLTRRRFTIAHEIGHFVLHHHLQRKELVHTDGHRNVVYRSQSASEGLDPFEVQANQFAASLLMPGKLLRSTVAKMAKPLEDAHVAALATEFKVSEQAMTIRLTTLGLL